MELKKIPRGALPAALAKARHYRTLSEPNEAESICLDILEVDPTHQEALKTLVLALSDQFERRLMSRFQRALGTLKRLDDEYARVYYEGVVHERRARAQLRRGGPRVGPAAREWLDRAIDCYEKAATLTDSDSADPLLRYNTCLRMIAERPSLRAEPFSTQEEPVMLE